VGYPLQHLKSSSLTPLSIVAGLGARFEKPISFSNSVNHSISGTADERDKYSATFVLIDTLVCLRLDQMTVPFASWMIRPEKLFLTHLFWAKSESQNDSMGLFDLLKVRHRSLVCFRYLIKCFARLQCPWSGSLQNWARKDTAKDRSGRVQLDIQGDSKGHVQYEIRDRGLLTESGKVGYLRSKMHQL